MQKDFDPGCLTLPEEMCDQRDFKAEEAINLDYQIQLPETYSLGIWIYQTSNQGNLGACTSLGTIHGVQTLIVRKNGKVPVYCNILTPDRKDLWSKMGHSTIKYDGWDYVEKAITTALNQGVLIKENNQLAKFDAYATENWTRDDLGIEKIKRYIYNKDPIIWCVRGDNRMWNEMKNGRVISVPETTNQGHCIALVGWDKGWFWFINSWGANDHNKLKSRFYIDYETIKKLPFNYRYWVLYLKEDEKYSAEYLKRKNNYLLILKTLKKIYNEESVEMKKTIEQFSQSCRKNYKELDNDLPLN